MNWKARPRIFADTARDAWSVVFVILCGTIPFVLAVTDIDWFLLTFFVILSSILNAIHINNPMHNQIHRRVFVSDRLNRIYEYLCIVPGLVGFQEYRHLHLQHHRYNNDPAGDPVSTYRFGQGKEESVIKYAVCMPFRNLGFDSNLKFDLKRHGNEVRFKFLILLLMAVVNIAYVPVFILTLYLSWVCNAVISYSEHHGAVSCTDERRDSVSCYNWLYNCITFNGGYHQEHHYRPGFHWSRLPELTDQLPADRKTANYPLSNLL